MKEHGGYAHRTALASNNCNFGRAFLAGSATRSHKGISQLGSLPSCNCSDCTDGSSDLDQCQSAMVADRKYGHPILFYDWRFGTGQISWVSALHNGAPLGRGYRPSTPLFKHRGVDFECTLLLASILAA